MVVYWSGFQVFTAIAAQCSQKRKKKKKRVGPVVSPGQLRQ